MSPLSLPQSWTFWYLLRQNKQSVQAANYEHNIHPIATFKSAEDFWALYSHLRRPADLPANTDYQLFREGVKPAWEDAANAHGGKLLVRLRKGLACRLWEHLVLALLAGDLTNDPGLQPDEICGIILSVRYNEDILSIWNRNGHDEGVRNRLRGKMRAVLSLPPGTPFEYKAHDVAMKDNSSFRNTEKSRPTQSHSIESLHARDQN